MGRCKIVKRRHGNTTHGLTKTPTYRRWAEMYTRCYNCQSKAYCYYGKRGIKVCRRWHNYLNFLKDMGEVTLGLQLDRLDYNGNYTPANCRWSTCFVQSRNKRNNKWITYKRCTKCLRDWEIALGLRRGSVSERLKRGWKPIDALTIPARSIRHGRSYFRS